MGLFSKIFGKRPVKSPGSFTEYRLLNSYDSSFTAFSGDAWSDDKVRAAVDSFARRAAVVQPRHIRRNDGAEIPVSDKLNRLLQFEPNPYSTAYKFYYRLAANYKIFNGAFVYPYWDQITGELRALYNINASDVRLKEYAGEMFVQFSFTNGNQYTFPYSELIYVGGHFLDNDIFGSNNAPLVPVLQTAKTFNQSMSKFAELVAVIRGILKVQGGVKNEDLTKRRDEFVRDNLRLENNGAGIVVTDNKYDYTPLTDKTTPIPDKQLEYIKNSIFDYFGTNEDIVQNKETPEQASAFYEGELKPFFVQLSQALTNCLFTKTERGYGNEVVADINTLQYAKIADKLQAVKYLSDIGALSLDQALTTLGFPPIGGDEGRRRVQTLNVVNADKADEYQLGEGDGNTDPPPKKDPDPEPAESEGDPEEGEG